MRRIILPAVLLVVALAAGFMARSADAGNEPDALPTDPAEASPETPVLSARRAPDLVAVPAAEAALAADLAGFVDTLPAETCLSVRHDGRALFDHNEALPLVPASAQKLVTGRVALDLLSPEATFRTTVYATENADDGVVEGDLWLVGGGDPVLATDGYLAAYESPPLDTDLETLADELVANGLTAVTGGVNADETRYDSVRYLEVWPERFIDQNQTGPLGAMTVNDAFVSFPSTDFHRGDAIPADDPALAAAAVFDDLLEERGVSLASSGVNQPAPPDLIELATIESAPVRAIVGDMVMESDNATAELLVKEFGFVSGGDNGPGTTQAGIDAAQNTIAASELPVDGLVVTDGSGLSPENRLTCQFLVSLLEDEGPSSDLTQGLSVAGESGTLRERFIGTEVEGNLAAKTGTLNDVTALTGFLDTASGDTLVFSFIVNQPDLTLEALAYQNTLVETLARYPSGVDITQLSPT